ncbi:MAG: hypothetical protein JWL90_3110 [Chthoniobacteraceae bacterium]|nr:hypothetical protein [Chthoniobacteraceae bacterium]
MNPRSLVRLLALATAALVIWWVSRPPVVTPPVVEPKRAVLQPTQPPKAEPIEMPKDPPEAVSSGVNSPPSASLPAAALPQAIADTDLEKVQMMFRDYRSALGENPVGTNAEITKTLTGDNLKQLQLSVPAGSQLNGNGEMIDRWGTPYFFHQLSAKQMEIRSAGPDRQMWTADDRLAH